MAGSFMADTIYPAVQQSTQHDAIRMAGYVMATYAYSM